MGEPFDFDAAFQSIKEAMAIAAKATDSRLASAEAERLGLIEKRDRSRVTTKWEWRRIEGNRTLVFRWRSYDETKPFSPILADINVLSLELTEDGKVMRASEQRFEDQIGIA